MMFTVLSGTRSYKGRQEIFSAEPTKFLTLAGGQGLYCRQRDPAAGSIGTMQSTYLHMQECYQVELGSDGIRIFNMGKVCGGWGSIRNAGHSGYQ